VELPPFMPDGAAAGVATRGSSAVCFMAPESVVVCTNSVLS